MKKAIYFCLSVALVSLKCSPDPDPRESYRTEYFCFEGYRGVGVVTVPSSPGSYTISVYADPSATAIEVASLTAEISSLQKNFSIINSAIKEDALFEFAYEQFGLPVELIQNDWVKVRLGQDASGNNLSGWIRNVTPVVLENWATYLPTKATFLAVCEAPLIYKSPGIEPFDPKMRYTYDDIAKIKRPDYRIQHLEVNGEWLKVRFVTPSNLCGSNAQNEIIIEGWVPLLLDDKSPAVWFYPRGC